MDVKSACKPGREIPLIQVAYPNENKSHIKATPVTGTPGVDPCCAPSPCPGYNEASLIFCARLEDICLLFPFVSFRIPLCASQ